MSDELKKARIVIGAGVVIFCAFAVAAAVTEYFAHVERMACLEHPDSSICERGGSE